MRIFLTLLFIYFAFLIQTAIKRFTPELVLLLLIIFALYEPKGVVLILGLFAGFCLDLINPKTFGFNLMICLVVGFGVSALQGYIYHGGRYLFILLGLTLVLRYFLAFILLNATLPLIEIIVASLITLILVIPLHSLIQRLFSNQWKPA